MNFSLALSIPLTGINGNEITENTAATANTTLNFSISSVVSSLYICGININTNDNSIFCYFSILLYNL